MKRIIAIFMFTILMGPLTGSLTLDDTNKSDNWFTNDPQQISWHPVGSTFAVPEQIDPIWAEQSKPWWERSSLDKNRNSVHDSIELETEPVGIALSYSQSVNDDHLAVLTTMGIEVRDVIESVNGVLLGLIDPTLAPTLASLDDVVMVQRYGEVVFYGDCLLYTSPSPRDGLLSRMPSSA